MIGIYSVVVVANYSQYNATAFTTFKLIVSIPTSEPAPKIFPSLDPPPSNQVV
jgi:hypothetical protein